MAPFYTRAALFLPPGVHRKTLRRGNYQVFFHIVTKWMQLRMRCTDRDRQRPLNIAKPLILDKMSNRQIC